MTKAIGRTVVAILAAIATIVIAGNATGLIRVPGTLLLAAILASAGIACLVSIAGAWSEWSSRRAGARRDSAEFQLSATLWAVVDQVRLAGSSLDYRDLGLATYRLHRRRPFGATLVRQHRVRAAHRLTTSDVSWQPGKGVIGACVAQGQVIGIDLVELYGSLSNPTAADWAALPDDVRMGLSHEEYLELESKYAVVVAVPVIDDRGSASRVQGCVALDGPAGTRDVLTAPEVVDLLNTLAQGLLRQDV